MEASVETNAFDGWYDNQIEPLTGQQQEQQQEQEANPGQASQQVQEGVAESSPAPLPEGWEEMTDPQSGRHYYIDHENQVTTWERPVGGIAAETGDVATTSGDGGDVAGDESNNVKLPSDTNDTNVDETQAHGWQYPPNDGVGGGGDEAQMPALDEAYVGSEERQILQQSLDDARTRHFEERWDKNIEELKAYKEKHGNTRVPQKSGTLGRWVNNQRQFYAKRANGGKSCLTMYRIKQLEELGFVWTLKKGKHSSSTPEKKAPKKRRKRQSDPGKSKTSKPSSKDANVTTKLLPDGTQVIESDEKITHGDGSTVDIEAEEAIKKRTIRLADGTRILETTTRIVTTRIERIVLPLPKEESSAIDAREGKQEVLASAGDEVHPDSEPTPAEENDTSEPTSAKSGVKSGQPVEPSSPSKLRVEEGMSATDTVAV